MAGWSSWSTRWAHIPKIVGSNPTSATTGVLKMAKKGDDLLTPYTLKRLEQQKRRKEKKRVSGYLPIIFKRNRILDSIYDEGEGF